MRAAVLALFAANVALLLARSPPPGAQQRAPAAASGCVACHAGIEDMHPAAHLSCVDCHGGKESAARKEDAHVSAPAGAGADERVVPLEQDLAWRRFQNPMDLRVAK